MSKNCIITVDAGTSSLRSIASWQDGTAFLRSSRRYQPQYARPATVEQEPLTWTDALLLTLREVAEGLTAQGLRPAAISLTSQRASVIPTNDKGEALHAAIMWQDKRSIPQCETLQRTIGLQTIYARTGLRIDPYFSLPKMLWLKKTLPDVYGRASKLLGVQDYIAHFMTARFITDWTQASRTMLMDIHKHIWDPVLLEETGIEPSKLPELCPPGYCIGGVTKEFSRLAGIPSGTPVILAGGDQQCAALGMNILSPGEAEVTTGTGSFILLHCNKPLLDPALRTLCSSAAIPSAWISEAPMLTTGAVYQWLAEQLYPELTGESAYTVLSRDACNSPVGANGLLLLPHFEGSAAPYWNPLARGLLFNLSLGTTRGEIARATLEGICLEIADNLSILEQVAGPITTLKSAGGLNRVPLFLRVLADSTGKTIRTYSHPDASALGAALSCAVTLNIYADYREALAAAASEEVNPVIPCGDNVIRYREIMHQRRTLLKALQEALYDS